MDDKHNLALVGILCITAIEIVALLCGVNGRVLSVVVGGISAIIGAVIGVRITTKK